MKSAILQHSDKKKSKQERNYYLPCSLYSALDLAVVSSVCPLALCPDGMFSLFLPFRPAVANHRCRPDPGMGGSRIYRKRPGRPSIREADPPNIPIIGSRKTKELKLLDAHWVKFWEVTSRCHPDSKGWSGRCAIRLNRRRRSGEDEEVVQTTCSSSVSLILFKVIKNL